MNGQPNVPKSAITQNAVKMILQRYFNGDVKHLSPIKPGHFAQVYSFQVGQIEYVIRAVTSTKATSFTKEQFIFSHLLSEHIPVPQILCIGQTGECHYAIASRIPGVPLDTLSQPEQERVLPQLIALLDAIHQTDISAYQGYGYFDERGIGAPASWHTYLRAIKDEEPEEFYFGKWHTLFDETFLDKEHFFRIYQQMEEALTYCSEERHLLHGDYGFDNILVKAGLITGILDWSQAHYGDPLYEVGRLDFWSPCSGYLFRFREYYQVQGRQMPHFEKRIRCYQCHTALDALRFFAKNDDQQAYNWVLNRSTELQLLK